MDTLLRQLGLSEGEVALYLLLLERADATPGELIKLAGLKRGDTYNKLYELKKKGLVAEFTRNKKKHFRAEHPAKLEELVNVRVKATEQLRAELREQLPKTMSRFNLSQERPGVTVVEGLEGIGAIYDNILENGQDFQLVRAKYHPLYEEQVVPKVINGFIRDRVKRGIHVEALTPQEDQVLQNVDKDKEWLYDRTWVSPSEYNAPVEIDIYGDRVAFLSFGKEMIGTVLQSPQIARAMRQLFRLAKHGANAQTHPVAKADA